MNILTSPADRLDDHGLLRSEFVEPHVTFAEQAGIFLGVFVPFVGLIFAIYELWGHWVGWFDMGLMLVMYSITVIGITVGYHRLLTHRSFETYGWVRYLLVVAGSMSLQGPALQWCGVHRRHHQSSDREGDPHSPHLHGHGFFSFFEGMWHAHVGWLFEPTATDLTRSIRDLLDDKYVVAADKLFWLWVFLGYLIPGALGGLVMHSWMGVGAGLLWGGLVRMCLMHHATFSINSVCHLWGTRPYVSTDHSRNNPIFGVVSFGEGWHNNHHAFPTSARHGLAWWQFDISWIFISFLRITGLAWNIRLPSKKAMEAKLRKPGVVAAPVPSEDFDAPGEVAALAPAVDKIPSASISAQ